MTSTLLPIIPAVDDVLFNFAQSDDFWANLETAFGTSYDVVKATELRQQWQSRNFSQLPPIEVLSGEVLGLFWFLCVNFCYELKQANSLSRVLRFVLCNGGGL
ncbi:hypothetical protein [Microcystis aeruginosa]|uniref:hypothetical protein n=1 Tax=Microcystis aeruginosa TaxID=1126 RepID=UPI0021AB78F3|nr:hypothetical protein [Microcystis aeruginosa]